MFTPTLYTCNLCNKDFKFDKIRYTDDGKRIVCLNCYKESVKLQKNDVPKKRANKVINDSTINLICIDCRYKFSFKKKSKSYLRCPYCSGLNLIRDEITADRLIEEVSSNIDRHF